MSSSSFSTPLTPRFRPSDTAEEPLILPRYQAEPHHTKPHRYLTRNQTILLCALLSLSTFLLILYPPTHLLSRPALKIPVINIDTIHQINATLVQSSNGTKWTIPIPHGINAPLRPQVYRDICRSAHETAAEAHGHEHGHHSYYWFDKLFIDPSDTPITPPEGQEFCDASLTYLLESTNAGFGVSLMGLWSAYGLAKKEGRAFFINDRDWAWGSYITYFIPPPTKCAPPPPHWLVPCPHRAKHLVVAPATHTYIFGHAFTDEFEDPRKMGVLRQIDIFDLARQGYESLFRLSVRKDDFAAVEDRKRSTPDPVTAVHVRRGDKHAVSFEFKKGYVPLADYAAVAKELAKGGHGRGSVVYASDDPVVYAAGEFAGFEPAQYGGVPEKGFVAEEFWGMDMAQREAVGRAYVRDLKTLGELAGRRGNAVCDGASVTCRLVAVIMGWERAVVGGWWRNVDGGFDWSGVDW